MSVRNFVNLTLLNEGTSFSDTNSVLTVQNQRNTPVGTAVRVHLIVKYVETSTLRFSTIRQGQKTRPRPHRRLVLKFATEDLSVLARGLYY